MCNMDWDEELHAYVLEGTDILIEPEEMIDTETESSLADDLRGDDSLDGLDDGEDEGWEIPDEYGYFGNGETDDDAEMD